MANFADNILRQSMLEIAPRVEEISGLRAPRRYGHAVHPRIKWVTDSWHSQYYGFYRPDKKIIYLNAHWVTKFIESRPMTLAVIAHEYTHYLQDLRWSRKDWNDIPKLERFAYEVENHFIPGEYEINIDEQIKYLDKPMFDHCA